MAQEILVRIAVESAKANKALAQNSQSFKENKKSVDALTAAKNKLSKLQKQEAIDLEIANQQIKIQKALNEAAAKSHLGLSNAKKEETIVDRQLRKAEEKLAFLRSDEALKLQRINEQIKIQNDLNTALIRSELGVASSKASVNAQQKQFRAQSGLNNAILLEAGRLASDASFGFTAIANNLSQIISLGSSFVATTGSFKTAMKELGRSLLGTGGFLIGVQLLISFMPKIISFFTKASEEAKKMEEELRNATKTINDQIDAFDRLTKPIQEYGANALSLRETVKLLKEESADFARALENLEDKDFVFVDEAGTARGQDAIKRLVFQYNQYLKAQKEEETSLFNINQLKKELEEIEDLDERATQTEKISRLEATYLEQLKERRRLQDILFQEGFDFSEIDVDLSLPEENKSSLLDFIRDPSEDDEFMEMLNDIPEYIDNAEEVAEDYALTKGKQSLLSRIFKLDPKSRKKDLEELKKATKKFGSEALFQTEEYRKAKEAINKKWDEIERAERSKHLRTLLNNISDFLNAAAQLNEKNKDLARAAIIASSAAASVGIWQSYHDITAQPKGFLATAGAVTAQAALVLSTINALKQLESNSVSSQSNRSFQAPDFNVVGASGTNQLAQAIGGNEFVVQPVAFESDLSDALNMGDANTGRDLENQRSLG